jgi:adenylosuccinate synthase
LLDIDHGTFPYVTSSNSSAAGIAAGSGVPTGTSTAGWGSSRRTRPGSAAGPFPTELDDEIGERIRRSAASTAP